MMRRVVIVVVVVVGLVLGAGCYRPRPGCNPLTDRAGCAVDAAH